MELWCEHWNIKINEDKAQTICSHRRRTIEAFLTLKGRKVPFINKAKCLGVIFDKKITWRLHTATITFKALRIFLSIYPLLKIERLSVDTKLTLYKILIRSIMNYAYFTWELAADSYLLKCSICKTKLFAPPVTYQGAHRPATGKWLSKFRTYTIKLHNYAGNRQQSY
jgi:hypothetical protein